jgi:phage terminase large subunit GpA-like protein
MNNYQLEVLEDAIESMRIHISNETPSRWYEKNMIMPKGSAFPGPIRYDRTPYWREVVDCADPNHEARDVTIMGPAQMGKSIMVLNPIVGYTIAENPGNILFLTGHSDLTKKAVLKIDYMLDNTNLRKLIKPSILKARNNRTGDTSTDKEFRGGDFKSGAITNHNMLRQNDVMIAIADDLDAGQMAKGDTGSTVSLIKGRTKAFESKCKRYWVSTPQVKGQSLIESQFEKSDKRYFNVICPCCKEPIVLQFKVVIDEKEMAGLTWKFDNFGRVEPKSVGYICQKCAGFFTDQDKHELLNSGVWVPTATPKEHYHYGYGINGLYAAPGMTSWLTIASTFEMCNPPDQPRKEADYQTFLNIDLGELYEPPKIENRAIQIMKNIRPYEVEIVPEDLSIRDGNGQIVMLTCGIDLNGVYGKENRADDVRLDYEVLAWSESGSTYSIEHGSFGTFIFRETEEQKKKPREKWTYAHNKSNSVWPLVKQLLSKQFTVSGSNRKMSISITAMDTGYCEKEAFEFIDLKQFMIVGVKGNPENKYKPLDRITPNFKVGQSRSNLFILDGHNIKDELAALMRMQWNQREGQLQPTGFMNFPGHKELYQYSNYFSHYEAEARVEDKDERGNVVGFVWQKKNSTAQNHFFDCRYYNLGAKEIIVDMICRELKVKGHFSWNDYARIILGK